MNKRKSDFLARFGFRAVPFTREVSVAELFTLEDHELVLTELADTIKRRMSAALIAPAGTGKTALVRRLQSLLPEVHHRTHYVEASQLSRRDMCRQIATVVGTEPAGSYPALLLRIRERFASSLDTDGVLPMMILDDAHELKPAVLGLVKVLTNFSMDSRLVVSVLLVGQPPLRNLLRRTELEDVARRLAHIGELRLLSRTEAHRYIEHRCTVVGARKLPFDSTAIDAIYEMARGNMRATDRLALKSLELAHAADVDVVDVVHVGQARPRVWP